MSLMSLSFSLAHSYPQSLQCSTTDGRLPLHLAVDHPGAAYDTISYIISAYPEALEQPDDEGYLPLHIYMEQDVVDERVLELMLSRFKDAAKATTKEGFLPLHCLISSLNPDLRVVHMLVQANPFAIKQNAVDLVPTDDRADPSSWNGPWAERNWTPLSRATDRQLSETVEILKQPGGRIPPARGGIPNQPPVRVVQPSRQSLGQLPPISRSRAPLSSMSQSQETYGDVTLEPVQQQFVPKRILEPRQVNTFEMCIWRWRSRVCCR